MVLPLGDAWLISDLDAKETYEPSVDEQGRPFLISYEVSDVSKQKILALSQNLLI